MRTRILVIENDKSYAKFLKNLLIDQGYEASVTDTGLSALKKLDNKQFDLILTSYYLPNLRGNAFFKEIRNILPKTPIIFLSHETNKDIILDILSFPRADYLVKPVAQGELLAHIEAALTQNKKIGAKEEIKIGDLVLNLEAFTLKKGENEYELSPTEFALLKYLMVNAGRVLTREMILKRVWGYSSDVSSRVVDVYVGYLRDKIDRGEPKKYLETVRGFGYKFNDK